jgi:hypothetical protein
VGGGREGGERWFWGSRVVVGRRTLAYRSGDRPPNESLGTSILLIVLLLRHRLHLNFRFAEENESNLFIGDAVSLNDFGKLQLGFKLKYFIF